MCGKQWFEDAEKANVCCGACPPLVKTIINAFAFRRSAHNSCRHMRPPLPEHEAHCAATQHMVPAAVGRFCPLSFALELDREIIRGPRLLVEHVLRLASAPLSASSRIVSRPAACLSSCSLAIRQLVWLVLPTHTAVQTTCGMPTIVQSSGNRESSRAELPLPRYIDPKSIGAHRQLLETNGLRTTLNTKPHTRTHR